MSKPMRAGLMLAAAVLVFIAPLYLDQFWLRLGFAVCGAAVGAIGLNLLSGATGQLSLAHAFFLAVGAVSYSWFAGDPDPAYGPRGLGLPPIVAMILAVALAALAGLAFSPISRRLNGLYLGIASLALVFIGQHLLATLTSITGGFEGRSVPDFAVPGLTFADSPPLAVMGVEYGRYERLWYLGFVLLAVVAYLAGNLLRGKPGRAMRLVRDREHSAGVVGVDVRAWKRNSFVISSALAGLSGVMFGLLIGSVSPVSFTLEVSIQYLVMIVVGGLASVAGSIIGALYVTALPLLLAQWSVSLDLAGHTVSSASLARYIYGLTLVLVLLVEPRGLVSLFRRLPVRRRPAGRRPLRYAQSKPIGRISQ